MESEGKEDIVAGQATVPSVEIALGHGEGVSKVEGAIHVGVGEGLEILGLVVGFSHKILMPFPDILGPLLQGYEFVSASGVLHCFRYGAK